MIRYEEAGWWGWGGGGGGRPMSMPITKSQAAQASEHFWGHCHLLFIIL